jgi:hypothetical protein
MDAAEASLSAELESLLMRELARSWRDFNHAFFHGGLRGPVMALSDAQAELGRWDPVRRRLTLSRAFVLRGPWGAVMEVLKHEMAHQYAHEVLGAHDEAAHGPAFRRVCERMGVDPAASGVPAVDPEASPEQSRLLKRVADLLALAQSQNRHEAENAAALAHKLMLKHNIALCEAPSRRRYAFRYLGEPRGRVPESDHILAAILADHFFVEAIWVSGYRPHDGKRGQLLEICGTPENLEIASYVHEFVRRTADRLWREHKAREGIAGDRDRRTFVAGVMEGFSERLQGEKHKARAKGLVWVGDAELGGFLRTRHPHIRSVRLRGSGFSDARAQGRSAGRGIVLHRGVKGTSSGEAPRALPPPKR